MLELVKYLSLSRRLIAVTIVALKPAFDILVEAGLVSHETVDTLSDLTNNMGGDVLSILAVIAYGYFFLRVKDEKKEKIAQSKGVE